MSDNTNTLKDVLKEYNCDEFECWCADKPELIQALNLYIEERIREGKIEELNYTEDKMFDESASKGEWGIPTKWSKEKYGGENYADLWTPNEVVHKVFQNRLKELENTLPRGLKGDI